MSLGSSSFFRLAAADVLGTGTTGFTSNAFLRRIAAAFNAAFEGLAIRV